MPDVDRILPTHAAPSAALHKTFGHLRTCLRAFG
jgi:hypothetical protein